MTYRQSILITVSLLTTCVYPVGTYKPDFGGMKWDWQTLEAQGSLAAKALEFPRDFLFGAGTSAQQVEGTCINNNWYDWEQQHLQSQTRDSKGHLLIEDEAGNACNHHNRDQVVADIQRMKQCGLNAYRFSVEWSKIEPNKDQFDADAIDYYTFVCRTLIDHGIQPVITLYHYTEPRWFAECGGFEKEENIHYFVRFCQKIYANLHPYVHLWLTFNSPASAAINGYYRGTRPPGKKSMQTAMHVLQHMLQAHVAAYHGMKAISTHSKIGILHNIMHLDLRTPSYNPLEWLVQKMGNTLTNTCVYKFFTDGIFYIYIPGQFIGKGAYVNAVADDEYKKMIATSLDFIGLNYYSHNYIHGTTLVPADDEIPTDNPMYTIYAEGLYRALRELNNSVVQPLQKITGKTIPLYVTENGIATEDDQKRDTFFRRTLYALSESCKQFNVKGYLHWALIDNCEWGAQRGSKRYGIFHVNFDTQKRTFKPGAQHYCDVIAEHHERYMNMNQIASGCNPHTRWPICSSVDKLWQPY